MPRTSSLLTAPVVVAALVAIWVAPGRASAEESDFIVADDDGYGIAECMKPGQECGRVIADAWCESHGHGHASAFGLAADITGSIKVSTATTAAPGPNAVVIRCGE